MKGEIIYVNYFSFVYCLWIKFIFRLEIGIFMFDYIYIVGKFKYMRKSIKKKIKGMIIFILK